MIQESNPIASIPQINSVRHELKFRKLKVSQVDRISPHMIRIKLYGDDLDQFTSLAFDDHVKIFIHKNDTVYKRDYTPRYFDSDKKELVLDFAVHDAGPATDFALTAKVGDELEVAGPKGSRCITGNITNWIMIGDETALPAIGRCIENLGAGTNVTSIIMISDPRDQQVFETKAVHAHHWIHRQQVSDHDTYQTLEILNQFEFCSNTFFWIAGEATMVNSVKKYLKEERDVDSHWIKSSGYWKQGIAQGD